MTRRDCGGIGDAAKPESAKGSYPGGIAPAALGRVGSGTARGGSKCSSVSDTLSRSRATGVRTGCASNLRGGPPSNSIGSTVSLSNAGPETNRETSPPAVRQLERILVGERIGSAGRPVGGSRSSGLDRHLDLVRADEKILSADKSVRPVASQPVLGRVQARAVRAPVLDIEHPVTGRDDGVEQRTPADAARPTRCPCRGRGRPRLHQMYAASLRAGCQGLVQ